MQAKAQDKVAWRRLIAALFFYSFIYLFLFATIITKNIRKEEKKKWRGDLTETIGDYQRLGLLEPRARAVSHQLKKDGKKSKMERFMNCFHIYSII